MKLNDNSHKSYATKVWSQQSRILKAQRIYQKIFDKNESFNLGDEDDEYYPSEEEEDDDEEEEVVEIEEESEVVHQSSPTLPEVKREDKTSKKKRKQEELMESMKTKILEIIKDSQLQIR